jgi:threonine aldolase
MASKLYDGVLELAAKHPEVIVRNKAEANAVFPELPEDVANKVMADYRFYVWNQATGQVRWMCAWDTTQEDVDGIIQSLKKALKN